MITPLPMQAQISENLEFATTHAVGDLYMNRKMYETTKRNEGMIFFSLRAHIILTSLMENFNQEKKKRVMHGPCRGAGGGARAGC
jgi:hypothetical protein